MAVDQALQQRQQNALLMDMRREDQRSSVRTSSSRALMAA
jgi:hypothetical protein